MPIGYVIFNVFFVKGGNYTSVSPLGTFKRVAMMDEIFDIIFNIHVHETQHSGQRKTFDAVSSSSLWLSGNNITF